MDSFYKLPLVEKGSITVIALLILVVLTIIGVSATSTTRVEIQIAGNQTFHTVAFNNADSGIYATPKIISSCLDNNTEPNLANVIYLGTSGTFYGEVMGFDPYDSAKDVRFTLAGFNVDVDVKRSGTQHLVGGGVEFASGSEGIGAGSSGGVAILYDIDSLGAGPSSSISNIVGVYRKVVGVPGGL